MEYDGWDTLDKEMIHVWDRMACGPALSTLTFSHSIRSVEKAQLNTHTAVPGGWSETKRAFPARNI